MRIPRAVTYRIRQVLDDWLPPAIRDRRLFNWLPARVLFGEEADLFLDFKERALGLTDHEFGAIYRAAHRFVIERDTDLNRRSLSAVRGAIVGENVLEVGCGSGYLAGLLATRHRVTATDIFVADEVRAAHPTVTFETAPISELPFADRAFDTVVTTHVLEHVQDIGRAVTELRRVCARRLVVVVPRQRPYRYTYDLHLHFFPYEYTLVSALNPRGPYQVRDLDGDWVYVEEIPQIEKPTSSRITRGA